MLAFPALDLSLERLPCGRLLTYSRHHLKASDVVPFGSALKWSGKTFLAITSKVFWLGEFIPNARLEFAQVRVNFSSRFKLFAWCQGKAGFSPVEKGKKAA